MQNKNILAILGVVVVLIIATLFVFSEKLGINTPNQNNEIAGPVAIVNGEEIPRSEFETLKSQIVTQQNIDFSTFEPAVETQFDAQIAEELIAQALVKQAAAASDISVSEEEVDAQIEIVRDEFGGQEVLDEMLDTEGISQEEFRDLIKTGITTQVFLERELNLSSVTATNEEIEALYNEAATQGDIAPLEEVRTQVELSVIDQKQQALIAEFTSQLRTSANIEVLL